MKEHPILFSREMVEAILKGRKTQTRRVIRPQPTNDPTQDVVRCPYGWAGDRLWVRESWAPVFFFYDSVDVEYADGDRVERYPSGQKQIEQAEHYGRKTRWGQTLAPSIHMPRWACRLVLQVTEVRIQRLQHISDADIEAEGIEFDGDWWLGAPHPVKGHRKVFASRKQAFRSLWNHINEERGYGWDTNPWVWAVSFRRYSSQAAHGKER
jgi:hypothetical protein